MMTDTVLLGESGRIVLPAAIRKAYGLETGERLTVIAEAGAIRLLSRRMALDAIRAGIVHQRGGLGGLLESIAEERRADARREADRG